ncbi:hypothetical protein H4R18_001022 [Coemansia javaensis]|uniref:Uncharacterized protein n=1 Tax=Coemansia javaensis TaxID=2761396 RepID=A0A9W8HKV6_9FUNG|nr:hypothetical protein H4R18_001022 [Coemansia javaensis]
MTAGFWTSDAPLGQLRVRIRADAQLGSQQRRLAVPADAYAALEASLERRAEIEGVPARGNETAGVYVSITAQHSARPPCVARATRAEPAGAERRSADSAQPVCSAGAQTWAAIFGRGAGEGDEDAAPAAAIEPIVPAGLTEVVLGADAEHYAAAQAARAEIAAQLCASPDVLCPGLVVTLRGAQAAGGAARIPLRCLMCQPVSQGVLCGGSRPRIIVTKLPPHGPDAPGDGPAQPDAADPLAEQWGGLGAEWFILGSSPLGSSRDRLAAAAFGSTWLAEAHGLQDAAGLPGAPSTATPGGGRAMELTAQVLEAPPDSASGY